MSIAHECDNCGAFCRERDVLWQLPTDEVWPEINADLMGEGCVLVYVDRDECEPLDLCEDCRKKVLKGLAEKLLEEVGT